MSSSPVDPAGSGDLGREIVRLASADNFRDVSGPGYRSADGVPLRAGVLFRSNELLLADVDAARLAEIGVTDLLDLREQGEVDSHPDAVVAGATWRHVPVGGIPLEDVASLPDRDAALATMRGVYRAFVEQPAARAAFAELFRLLAAGTGPQVFHCTAGKDRTGWAAAVLLRLCGVPEDVVVADYLRTNDVEGARGRYLPMVAEHLGEHLVPVYEAVLVADASYLAEADAAVAEHHGSIEAYVSEGLALSDDEVAALVARLR